MAYTTIDNPVEYFSATLYTGNGTARTIATGHQSDWVWLKRRDGAAGHRIADSVRGATKLLYSDSTTSEQTDAKSITGFVSTGFTLGDDANGYDVNTNTNTMVAWSWKAGGSASSNSNGSITSSVSANTTAGFSVVSYTGTGANATVGHGLGVAPKMFIVKNRSTATNWHVYHHKNTSAPETDYLLLNTTNATADNSIVWNDTAPTSSVFSIGTTDGTNKNTSNMIAYCFAEKKGYSKFGSYTGNGNADGTFVYTGFKPAFFLLKSSSSGTSSFDWVLLDNKRPGYNVVNKLLYPNGNFAEGTADIGDFTSNGFKIRSSNQTFNKSGDTFIYMAFAESPFVSSSGVPTTAR